MRAVPKPILGALWCALLRRARLSQGQRRLPFVEGGMPPAGLCSLCRWPAAAPGVVPRMHDGSPVCLGAAASGWDLERDEDAPFEPLTVELIDQLAAFYLGPEPLPTPTTDRDTLFKGLGATLVVRPSEDEP